MKITHVFDVDETAEDQELDLFAEELPTRQQMASDCLATAGSASTDCSTAATFGTLGSIVSSGGSG
jgi:hypothetical protein